MKYQKITNLLDTTFDDVARFITKNWVEVHDQSGSPEGRYKPSKQVRFKTSMLRPDLCDFSDAYIIVKGTITVTDADNDAYDKKLAFRNNAPSAANKYYSSTGHHEQKNKKTTGQITFSAVIIKQRIKLVLDII